MANKILYFGGENDAIRSFLHDSADSVSPGVFVTRRVDLALTELLERRFDCLVLDERVEPSGLRLLVQTASSVDSELPIIWRGGSDPLERGSVVELVDRRIEADEPIEPADFPERDTERRVGGEPSRNPVSGSVRCDRAMAHLDQAGTYLWVNEELADVAGAAPEELVGEPLDERAPINVATDLPPLLTRAVESGHPQWTGAGGDGAERVFCMLPLDDGTVLLVTRSSDSLLPVGENYLNRLDELFFVAASDGTLVYWNDAVNDVTGYSDAELLETRLSDVVAEEAEVRAMERFHELAAEGADPGEFTLVTKDGETIPYQFSGSRIADTDGTDPYVCAVGRDISRRTEMRSEIEEAIERLEASNEELERFAYVASHDLREPLRMVRSYLQLLQQRHGDELDEEATEFIEFAVDGAERMRSMIEDLLAYSRVGIEVRQERVDCNTVLDEVKENLSVAIEESNAEIAAEQLPTVAADRTLMLQLFQNLIGNAIEHADQDSPRVQVSAHRDGDEWEFAVKDENTGLEGFDEDVFQLFCSGDDGTGIGLAICRKIVETFDGDIEIDAESDVGCTVSFTLPAAETA